VSEQWEAHLRDVFREDAAGAPEVDALAETVITRARRERRHRMVWMSGVAAAAVGVSMAGLSVSGVPVGHQAGPVVASDSTVRSVSQWRTGPVPDSGTTDCEQPSSVAAIANRSFGFDGTVTSVNEPPRTSDDTPTQYATVTFTVHEWFRGGDAASASVTMTAPLRPGEVRGEDGPAYGVGSRLLVSGEPHGASLAAWSCGYTRYYDAASAAPRSEGGRSRPVFP
jgi:hypothetical protein